MAYWAREGKGREADLGSGFVLSSSSYGYCSEEMSEGSLVSPREIPVFQAHHPSRLCVSAAASARMILCRPVLGGSFSPCKQQRSQRGQEVQGSHHTKERQRNIETCGGFLFLSLPHTKAQLESGCSKVPRDIHTGLGVATSSTTGSGDIGSPENRMELQCAASRQIFLPHCSQSSLIKMAVWKAPFIPGFGECLDKCGCWSSLRASQEQKNLVGKRQRKTIRKHVNLECRVAKEATQLNVGIEECLDVLTGLGLLDTHFSS